MQLSSPHTRSYYIKWLLIILGVKLMMFVYFTVQFNRHARESQIHSVIAVAMGDTRNYYEPAEIFAHQGFYPSMCRMPGLLPVYVPFSFLFGQETAFVCVVVVQFLLSVLSVLLLAIIATRIFPYKYVFEGTALLYALSSFVSIWDHTLMSDSLATSSLIFSVYSLTSFIKEGKRKQLLLAGVWFTWSVFMRQIAVALLPVFFAMIIFGRKENWKIHFKNIVTISLPVVIAIGMWTYRNYKLEHVFVPFIKPVADCYHTYSPQFLAVNELLIAWGEDIQYWIPNTPAHWFNAAKPQTQSLAFASSKTSSICPVDSIIQLQNDYVTFKTSYDVEEKRMAGERVLNNSKLYKSTYIKENTLDYYLLNRLVMFKRFVFPDRLDNMPGPAFQEMNFIQKVFKMGYYLLLLLVGFFGVIYSFFLLIKRRWLQLSFAAIPWAFIILLAMYFGFIEQRYLVPVYPFFLVMMVAMLFEVAGVIARRRGA